MAEPVGVAMSPEDVGDVQEGPGWACGGAGVP